MKHRDNIKNTITAIACCLLGCSLLPSCSQDDSLPGSNDYGQRLPLGVSFLQAADIAETRAVATSDYDHAASIGFFVKADATKGYTAVNNREGTYHATRKLWLPTPDSIWLNNHTADIAVYAPYDIAQTSSAALDLAACLRPADGSKDIWCKHITANNKSEGLGAVLEHVYTRFTISLALSSDYKGTAAIDSLALTNAALYAEGSYRPFDTATPYAYKGDAGIGFKLATPVNLTTAAPSTTFDLLLLPTGTLTEDVTLGVTVGGITFAAILDKAKFAGKLEAGKQYNAAIKLVPGRLNVTSVKIYDWNDEMVADEKEPVFGYEPVNIASLGFLVAPANLVGTKRADGSWDYDFAPNPAYYIGTASGGDYFNWNTLDPTNLTANESAWSDARDPCRKVNDGWRTPTLAELTQIKDLPNCFGKWKQTNGSEVEGRYYGIDAQPSDIEKGNYIFLPISGARGPGSAAMINPTDGMYWTSSTARERMQVNKDGTSFYGISAQYGCSIRCVKSK